MLPLGHYAPVGTDLQSRRRLPSAFVRPFRQDSRKPLSGIMFSVRHRDDIAPEPYGVIGLSEPARRICGFRSLVHKPARATP